MSSTTSVPTNTQPIIFNVPTPTQLDSVSGTHAVYQDANSNEWLVFPMATIIPRSSSEIKELCPQESADVVGFEDSVIMLQGTGAAARLIFESAETGDYSLHLGVPGEGGSLIVSLDGLSSHPNVSESGRACSLSITSNMLWGINAAHTTANLTVGPRVDGDIVFLFNMTRDGQVEKPGASQGHIVSGSALSMGATSTSTGSPFLTTDDVASGSAAASAEDAKDQSLLPFIAIPLAIAAAVVIGIIAFMFERRRRRQDIMRFVPRCDTGTSYSHLRDTGGRSPSPVLLHTRSSLHRQSDPFQDVYESSEFLRYSSHAPSSLDHVPPSTFSHSDTHETGTATVHDSGYFVSPFLDTASVDGTVVEGYGKKMS